jgi:hypothetical protein
MAALHSGQYHPQRRAPSPITIPHTPQARWPKQHILILVVYYLLAENKWDFADIPSDVLDTLQIIFYSDPVSAAFRALELEQPSVVCRAEDWIPA